MIIDSHCHLNLDRAVTIQKAINDAKKMLEK